MPAPRTIFGALLEYGPESFAYKQLTEATRSLLPVMESAGIATAEEIDIATLADRIRDEAVSSDAVLIVPPHVGAWANTVESQRR